MKSKNIALALTIAATSLVSAQKVDTYRPLSFEAGSPSVKPFTNEERKFNDWSVSAGAGIPLIQSGDLTSINNGNGSSNVGYSFYVSVDKAINHVVGLSLQYDKGQTKQSNYNGSLQAKTNFDAVSLLADVNFSNIFRRVDNKSPYRWAFHGYAGVGLLAYKASLNEGQGYAVQSEVKPFTTGSLAFQAGAGVKYKINKRFDLGLRAMYMLTHTDSFDGGGEQYSNINMTEEQNSDNLFNFNFGVTYKIGKHISHLMWHDPLQEIYHRLDKAPKTDLAEVCKTGDKDNDGVCDDWDKQLDTPAGARVDGAGIALDADLDGVIDLFDKCVTVPGPVGNNGCPKEEPKPVEVARTVNFTDIAAQLERALEDVVFNFNRGDQVKEESYVKLDLAADIIKSSKGGTFLITGHTDKKGNDIYNLKLSRERAKTVVLELEKRGVSTSQLKSKGVGEKFAKVPETATDIERLKDRKVTVEYITGAEWNALPKSDVK